MTLLEADLLLARGADPSLRTTDGKSAADLAREHGHEESARRLDSLSGGT